MQKPVAIRMGSLYEPFKQFCLQHEMTVSEGVRILMQEAMKGSSFELIPKTSVTETLRQVNYKIRLTSSEAQQLLPLAQASGYGSVNRFVRALLRAYLQNATIFPESLLIDLRDSNKQLLALGRNINQISKDLNMHHTLSDHRFKSFEMLTREIMSLKEQISSILEIQGQWKNIS